MKRVLEEAICLLLLSLSGCIVASIQPYYEKADLVQDARIIGLWSCDGDEFSYMTIFDMEEGKYQIRSSERRSIDKEDPSQEMALFRIGNQLFADLLYGAGEGRNPGIPGHVIYRVEVSALEIKMTSLDADALKKALSERQIKTPYLIQEGTDFVILTGSTKLLKQFLAKHHMKEGLWKKSPSLHLRKAA